MMPATPLDSERAAHLLRAGRLVAFPTETVYGLGANALDPEAVARIYQAKGRPPTSPLIVHVDSVEMAKSLVTTWPEKADRLAKRFWPGPLTIILEKQPSIPTTVTATLPTVRLRMPVRPAPARRPRLSSPRPPLMSVNNGEVPDYGRGTSLQLQRPPSRLDIAVVLMPLSAPGYAALLYQKLHEADAPGQAWIAVDPPP